MFFAARFQINDVCVLLGGKKHNNTNERKSY